MVIDNLATKLYWARRLTWWSYALYVVCMLTGGYLRGTPWSLLIIATLPLLLLLPGMARENYKSLSMLCFLTLFYFTVIVLNLWSPNRVFLDWLSLALISVLFCAAMMFSRWKQHQVMSAYHQSMNDHQGNQP